MKLQVLMSTCNNPSIEKIDLNERNIKGSAIIVNQFADHYSQEKKGEVELYSYNEKGLSKSRNRLIEHATKEISVITDDDITFVENYEELITDCYKKNPDADIITFNIKIGDKTYGKTNCFKHNLISVMSIMSCQISFKTESIKKNHILFNEYFGLGARYRSGEENIFLKSCLDKGLKIIHIPIVICEHPEEATTGEIWSKSLVQSKGALSYILLGKMHWLFFTYFLLIKRKFYKQEMTYIEFCKNYNVGKKEMKRILHEKNSNISK